MEDLRNIETQKYIDPYSYGEMTEEDRGKCNITVDENIDALYDEVKAQFDSGEGQDKIIGNFFAGMTPLYIKGGEFFVMLDKEKGPDPEPIVDRAHFQLWCDHTTRMAEIGRPVDKPESAPEKASMKDFTDKALGLIIERP